MHEAKFYVNWVHDLRFTLRTLGKNPGFVVVIVLTLALGIGVNTAIFSVIDGILLRPLPYVQPQRLVRIWDRSIPLGAFVALHERLRDTEVATYTIDVGFNLAGNGEAARVSGNAVSSNFFSLLGAQPYLGRVFQPGDEVPGKSNLAILSYRLWQSRFGSDPNIAGRVISVDNVSRQIVGVMPANFRFMSPAAQMWVPVEMDPDPMYYWSFGYQVIGRLRPGATLESARAEFKSAFPSIVKMIPFPMPKGFGADADMMPLSDFDVAPVRTMLFMLMGAVVLILLVACVNVANLMLVRSAMREKEIALRTALGAARGRIISQLLTESVLLGLAGGILGTGLALLSLGALKAILPADTPHLSLIAVDPTVLAFSTALSIATGLVFGLVPAFQASKPDVEQTLKANSHSAGVSGRRSRLSSVLAVIEVAFAVILVSGAAFLIETLRNLTNTNTGFQQEQLLVGDVTPSYTYCQQHNDCQDFYKELLERVRHLPGVSSAGAADTVPFDRFYGANLAIADRPETSSAPYMAWQFEITPGYLNALGIPLLRGRDFTETDRKGSPLVAIVSKTAAQALWPGQDPIGKQLKSSADKEWRSVVGLVDDVQHFLGNPSTTWAASAHGDVYFPAAQGIVLLPINLDLAVRAQGDLNALGRQIAATVAAINPTIPISRIRKMDEVVSASIAKPRSNMWLFSVFAGLALLLGVIGIYSVISYSVTQRTREIGIRMAMGADKGDVFKIILKYGSWITLTGLALGITGALALSRFMGSLLYGIRATDPLTYLIVAVVVATAAALACYVPSLRATRVEPTIALRYE